MTRPGSGSGPSQVSTQEASPPRSTSYAYTLSNGPAQARAKAIAMGNGVTLAYMASKQTKRIPEAPMKAFARVLADYVRERHGDNQTKAGHALGVSQGHISQIINGEKGPGLNLLLLMRLETGRSIDDMLGFKAAPADELIERLRATFELHVARAQRDARDAVEKLRAAEEELARLRMPESTTTPHKSAVLPAPLHRRRKA